MDVCSLPQIVGPCRAAFPRWHFNMTSQRCEQFTYGGCSGNANNFRTLKACNEKCICSLPKAEGICLAYFPSWYYNSKTGQCEEFVYGGCRGNMNRFYTREICLKTCESGKGKAPYRRAIFPWQVSWQLYFLVCTTNNFSLTAVHTNQFPGWKAGMTSFSTRLLVKENLSIFSRTHEQIKLVKENLSRKNCSSVRGLRHWSAMEWGQFVKWAVCWIV